jgi:hypothetical protein
MSTSSDTDAVIRHMAREAGDQAGRTPMRLEMALLLASLVAFGLAAALVLLSYGVQSDLHATVTSAPFHHKVASMLTLACGGVLLVASAGRPGASRFWIIALLPGLALLAYGAIADQSAYPFLGRSGISVPSCLGVIILLSIPALAIIMTVLRATGVITHPAFAGAVAGVLAGALGAAAYAIACRNDGSLFVALWYSTAVTTVAIIGAVAGRRWLAW